jgi:choloylglycine hydrolase
LQLFNIPQGIVRKEENNKLVFDCTLWTSASDLKNRCYFFHTYDNPTVRKIDLMSMNLEAKEIGIIPMKSPYFIDSLTKVS